MKVAQLGGSVIPKILGNGPRETGSLYQLIMHYAHNEAYCSVHPCRVRRLKRVFESNVFFCGSLILPSIRYWIARGCRHAGAVEE